MYLAKKESIQFSNKNSRECTAALLKIFHDYSLRDIRLQYAKTRSLKLQPDNSWQELARVIFATMILFYFYFLFIYLFIVNKVGLHRHTFCFAVIVLQSRHK